jgi:hypothetical protein
MICDPDPCQCFAKPEKAKAAPRPKKRPVEEVVQEPKEAVLTPERVASPPRPDLKARMKAAAAAAPPKPLPKLEAPAARRKPTPASQEGMATEGGTTLSGTSQRVIKRPVKSDDELMLHSAIRALKDVLHPDEMTRWGMVANSEPSTAERAAEWKVRRAWQLSQ